MMSSETTAMYQNLVTKNTFLDLPGSVGFDGQDLEVCGSSTRRSSSSPPALDRDSLWLMKEDLSSRFHLVYEGASTTDDGSEHSMVDDRSSACSELQDVAELVQAMPARPLAKDQKKGSSANPGAEQVADPQTVSTVMADKHLSFSHRLEQQNGVQDIPEVPAPEKPWARRRQVANHRKPAWQDSVGPDVSLKITAQEQKSTVQQTKDLNQDAGLQEDGRLICFFQNRHHHNPEAYAPCGKGSSCKFCHKMHLPIKRRNCKATAFCRCDEA